MRYRLRALRGFPIEGRRYYHRALAIQRDDNFAQDMLNYAVRAELDDTILSFRHKFVTFTAEVGVLGGPDGLMTGRRGGGPAPLAQPFSSDSGARRK